jgi:uncharacterized protein
VDKTLEELTLAECHELLERHHVGRLAFLDQVGVMPMIIPVNYLMHAESVVFRTDPGSKLTAALHDAPVAFEIDQIDPRENIGWSVVVRGHLEEVTDPTQREALEQAPLPVWAPGTKHHYVRLNPRLVTGRRIRVATLTSHWWG